MNIAALKMEELTHEERVNTNGGVVLSATLVAMAVGVFAATFSVGYCIGDVIWGY